MKKRIGAGIYVFTQEFGNLPNFKDITGKILYETGCQKLEIIFPLENPEGIPDFSYAKKEFDRWKETANKFHLVFPSAYFNFPFHLEYVSKYFGIIKKIVSYGLDTFPEIELLVCNPTPLNWNDPNVQKSDEQLNIQLKELKKMSGILTSGGGKLSYHFHTPELKDDAREFRFMMKNTDPTELGLTWDTNWTAFSGIHFSNLVHNHIDRIDNLHLRSSSQGTWDEILRDGDENNIDFIHLMTQHQYKGNFVIELADPANHTFKTDLHKRLDQSIKNLEKWLEDAGLN